MSPQTEPFVSSTDRKPATGFQVDYRRVLYRAIANWYLVALALAIGITLAYLINRYTTRIYPISASIIIRESQENTDASILYNNPLINQYRNYFNELYIIESYPIIQGVVEDLNFHISIEKEGNFKTTEQYNQLPIGVTILTPSSEIVPSSLQLEITDERTFTCSAKTDEDGSQGSYHFGDTTNCNGNKLIVYRKGDINRIKGERYTLSIRRPEDVATAYIGSLNLSWAAVGSSVINMGINSASGRKGTDFLNRLIHNYQQYDLNKKIDAAGRTIEFIEDQLDVIRDSLSRFEKELQTFKYQNILTDLSDETTKLYEQLKELDVQKMGLLISANYYNYLEGYIKDGSSLDKVVLPSSIGVTDPVLDGLVSQLLQTQSAIKALGNKSDIKNPLIQMERNRMEESKLRILESIYALRSTDGIKKEFIDKQIKKVEDELALIPGAERLLANIKRKYSFTEGMTTFLTQKLAEAGISKASTTSDVVVVNPPRVSGGAITPRILQNYAIFGGGGLLIPLIIFYLLEFLNNKVQSKEDIELHTSIPFIGGIGHKSEPSNLIVLHKPKSAISESFRALRSNLNFFMMGKDTRVILITSSISGEGKTFTTINLAAVFALAGKRTIIIGADLRKPKIFSDFALSNSIGLSSYLSGMATIDDIIQKTDTQNLDLISGGPVPPNPSELILGPLMDALIAKLKESYDFILLDTPPMSLITDGLVLTKYGDHTIYIIRQNYTPTHLIRSANELYVSGKIPNMSLILNDIRKSGLGYGYGYGYNYGYYPYGYYGGSKKGDKGYYQE